jgi:hypothetical protein
MRDEKIHLLGGDPGALHGLIARFGHGQHRSLEHFAARHLHVVRALANDRFADGIGSTATRPVEQGRELAIRLEKGGEDSAAVVTGGAPNDRRAGPVAEKDGGRAVLEVSNGGELLGANDEHVFALP